MKGEVNMYDNDDKPKLLKGLVNALLLEGLTVIVIIGLLRIIIVLLNSLNW